LVANVAFSAKEEVERVMFPWNPSTLVKVTVAVAEPPGFNENEEGKIER
jgi:hypothetical protein